MLRVAIVGALVAVCGLVGCGEDSSSSTQAAAASSDVRRAYYREMHALAVRLERTVSGAVAGDANALARIKDVLGQIRTRLEEYREESPGGQCLPTTTASAHDYARSGNRQGLRLIRRVPLIEARDNLNSEAG